MNEILLKINDEDLKELEKCIRNNKICGQFLPEFDQMHALALFVVGGIVGGHKEVTFFKVPEREGGY